VAEEVGRVARAAAVLDRRVDEAHHAVVAQVDAVDRVAEELVAGRVGGDVEEAQRGIPHLHDDRVARAVEDDDLLEDAGEAAARARTEGETARLVPGGRDGRVEEVVQLARHAALEGLPVLREGRARAARAQDQDRVERRALVGARLEHPLRTVVREREVLERDEFGGGRHAAGVERAGHARAGMAGDLAVDHLQALRGCGSGESGEGEGTERSM
jgi:hypothetical protein